MNSQASSTVALAMSNGEFRDPLIEAYKRDVDRTLLREKLRLTVAERFEQFDRFGEFAQELSSAGEKLRAEHQRSTAEP